MPLPSIVARTSTLLLALASASLLVACDSSPSPEESLAAASARLAHGDHDGAIIELKNALQQSPDDTSSRALLGRTFLAVGEIAAAEVNLSRAFELGDRSPETRAALAETHLLARRYRAALDLVESPESALEPGIALALQGRAELGLGEPDEAEQSLRAALDAAGDTQEARLGLVALLLATRRTEEAETHARAASEQAPEDPRGWLAYGEVAMYQRDLDAGVERLSRGLDAAKAQSQSMTRVKREIMLRLANLQLLRNEPAAAAELLAVLAARYPDSHTVKHLRAATAMLEGDTDGARILLQEVLAGSPHYDPSLLLLGIIHLSSGELGQALALAERLVANRPGSLPGRKLLGEALLRLGRPEDASEAMLPLAKRGLADQVYVAKLARALLASGREADAVGLLEAASRAYPDSTAVRRALVESQIEAGDAVSALAQLDEFAIRAPHDREVKVLRALVLVGEGHFEEAEAAARQFEQDEPDGTFAPYLRARIALRQGDDSEAKAHLRQVLDRRPDYTPAKLMMGQIATRAGDVSTARKWLRGALEDDPGNARALIGLAYLENREGRAEQALELLNSARESNPEDVDSRLLLAEYHLNRGDLQEAVDVSEEAVAALPNSPRALSALGSAKLRSGDPGAALEAFSRLASLRPNRAEPSYYMAMAYQRLGDVEAAKSALRHSMEINPGFLPAVLNLGELELQTGNATGALALADGAERYLPENPSLQIVRGNALLALGRPDDAARAFRGSIALGMTAPGTLGLARSLTASGKTEEAEALLRDFLARHPSDIRARMELASTYLQSGRMEAGISSLEAIDRTNDRIPVVVRTLALAYAATGNDKAAATARRAHALEPDSPLSKATLGRILSQRRESEAEGMELLRQAQAMLPDNPTVRYYLADALARAGDVAGARQQLELALARSGDFSERENAEKLLTRLDLL